MRKYLWVELSRSVEIVVIGRETTNMRIGKRVLELEHNKLEKPTLP